MRNLFGASLAVVLMIGHAHAQDTVADFYRGKQVKIVVGFAAGGNSGLYGDVLGRHMGKHLPGNPSFIPQYMPGAGGLIAANHIANRAARDGTEIAITSRTAAFEPLYGNKQANFEARALNWIGSANVENSVCIARADQNIRTFADVQKSQLVIGGSGADAVDMIFPRLANKLMDAKFKIVGGYNTSNDILLAMERREVHGFCGIGWGFLKMRHKPMLEEKRINILFQIAAERASDLKDVPRVADLARNPEDSQILDFLTAPQAMGRPFLAPPNVPKGRVAALRQAFEATLKDPDFIADAERTGLEIQFVSGSDVDQILANAYATPATLVQRANSLLHEK
jgi:tripartite-type tricarboxylate transporter receptor subunit TctC